VGVAEEAEGTMGRIRILLVVASLTMAGAALAIVPAAGAASSARGTVAAGTTGAASTETTPACGTAPAGYATCFVRVRHKVGSQASSSPSGYSPATIEKAYGFDTSDHGTGTGRTIALVDAYDDPTIAANLEAFSQEYGLPTCTSTTCFRKVNQTGGTSYPKETAGWDVEISLDVEWAHAIAPKAHILLVEASSNSFTNLFDAVRYAAAHATYVSMSWGGTEFTGETTYDGVFTPRVSFFAAAGDTRSEVIYPSASPEVISVGGTTLTVTSTGAWKQESAWSTGGGGCSKVETANPAQAAFPTYDQSGATCKGKRATPDVALDANPSTGVSVYDTIRTREFGSGWEKVGGTSVATPIWAAHSAAAGDHVNATFVYGSNIDFYDITSGSNGHTCVKGYNLCDGLGSWNTSVGTQNGAAAGSLSFTPATKSLTAGTAVGLSIELSASQTSNVSVTLTSTSAKGGFSTTGNPTTFTKSLPITVPAGSTTKGVYYEDTVAGSPTLTASSSGWTSGTKSVTVTAGTLADISVSPATVSLGEKATQTFTATGTDQYGNPVSIDPRWTTTGAIGEVTPGTGTTTTFTAGTTGGAGAVTATTGGVSGHATVTVTATPTLAVSVAAGSVSHLGRTYRVPLTVKVTGTSGGVRGAKVTTDVYSGTCSGTAVASGSSTTGSSGSASFTFSTSSTGTYCALATATASGYSAGSGTTSFSVTASTRSVHR
jgi:subtilase family serine protease